MIQMLACKAVALALLLLPLLRRLCVFQRLPAGLHQRLQTSTCFEATAVDVPQPAHFLQPTSCSSSRIMMRAGGPCCTVPASRHCCQEQGDAVSLCCPHFSRQLLLLLCWRMLQVLIVGRQATTTPSRSMRPLAMLQGPPRHTVSGCRRLHLDVVASPHMSRCQQLCNCPASGCTDGRNVAACCSLLHQQYVPALLAWCITSVS
jgi:hypothetical protein